MPRLKLNWTVLYFIFSVLRWTTTIIGLLIILFLLVRHHSIRWNRSLTCILNDIAHFYILFSKGLIKLGMLTSWNILDIGIVQILTEIIISFSHFLLITCSWYLRRLQSTLSDSTWTSITWEWGFPFHILNILLFIILSHTSFIYITPIVVIWWQRLPTTASSSCRFNYLSINYTTSYYWRFIHAALRSFSIMLDGTVIAAIFSSWWVSTTFKRLFSFINRRWLMVMLLLVWGIDNCILWNCRASWYDATLKCVVIILQFILD